MLNSTPSLDALGSAVCAVSLSSELLLLSVDLFATWPFGASFNASLMVTPEGTGFMSSSDDEKVVDLLSSAWFALSRPVASSLFLKSDLTPFTAREGRKVAVVV